MKRLSSHRRFSNYLRKILNETHIDYQDALQNKMQVMANRYVPDSNTYASSVPKSSALKKSPSLFVNAHKLKFGKSEYFIGRIEYSSRTIVTSNEESANINSEQN